jgi:O-antigen/teichoic acid export membrane protein
MNSQILMLSKHWKIDLFSNMFFVVISLVLNYYLTRKYGVEGPAYGTLIAICFFNLIRFTAIWKIYHLQPFSLNNLKVILIAAACYFLSVLIPDLGNLYVNVAIPSLVFVAIYSITILKFNISNDITEVYRGLLKRFS